MTTAAAGDADVVSPAWHESIRTLFHTAWNALDRAQLNLSSEYRATGDPRIKDFMQRFGPTIDAMTEVGFDELYPLTHEDLTEDDDLTADDW
jgi:hypothetical protein